MLEIFVDDKKIAAERFDFHYQTEPYPGGHRYKVSFADSELVTVFRQRFGDVEIENVNRSDAQFVFNLVRLTISQNLARKYPLLYWANSIQKMIVSSMDVIIEGECSPQKKPGGLIEQSQ